MFGEDSRKECTRTGNRGTREGVCLKYTNLIKSIKHSNHGLLMELCLHYFRINYHY